MKHLLFILTILTLMSCSPEEQPKLKNHYEYNSNQPIQITLDIVPMNDIVLEYEDMLLELNADYYNRYGINVNLNVLDRQQVPTDVTDGNVIYTPTQISSNITVFIIPQEHVKLGAWAYAVKSQSGGVDSKVIVLGDYVQTNRTLAHELGHILGLSHNSIKNNVMNSHSIAWQYDRPNNFNQEQVDIIKLSINNLL